MTEISVANEAINTPSQECNEDTDFSIRRNKCKGQVLANKGDASTDCTPTFNDVDENFSSAIGLASLTVKTSLTFKKPTNQESKTHSFDEDTQCESFTDSDGDVTLEDNECMMSEEEYVDLMEKTFFLVKDALDRRFRPLLSPTILKNKMYSILRKSPVLVEPDLLFEEGALEKSITMKRTRSHPTTPLCNRMVSIHANRKIYFDSMKKASSVRGQKESQISALFSFLRKE
ncbi:unnamed protein product [Moneuplotes crassus]|uniref:Uncharacterized protein n=1 Tax=Euplotes crassus TaxID=5936 RepID=A0AAD2DA04_EUPCR|nr:unnamed protein product [Moneuplotes crassus]